MSGILWLFLLISCEKSWPGASVPSPFMCCVYKLFLLKLGRSQIKELLESRESVYLRCAGVLYLRCIFSWIRLPLRNCFEIILVAYISAKRVCMSFSSQRSFIWILMTAAAINIFVFVSIELFEDTLVFCRSCEASMRFSFFMFFISFHFWQQTCRSTFGCNGTTICTKGSGWIRTPCHNGWRTCSWMMKSWRRIWTRSEDLHLENG